MRKTRCIRWITRTATSAHAVNIASSKSSPCCPVRITGKTRQSTKKGVIRVAKAQARTFNHKQQCYINTIQENIFYYTMKNDGRKPTVIFMSEPLYQLLCGKDDVPAVKFMGIRVFSYNDSGYSYYFADDRQKGREP